LALFNLVKYEDAAACYNKALEIVPNLKWAWVNRGTLDRIDISEEALGYNDKAIEIDLKYLWPLNSKGFFRRIRKILGGYYLT